MITLFIYLSQNGIDKIRSVAIKKIFLFRRGGEKGELRVPVRSPVIKSIAILFESNLRATYIATMIKY